MISKCLVPSCQVITSRSAISGVGFREVAELVVSVIQARDLETNQVTGTLDSYVKVWLTPHAEGKCTTKVKI